MSRITLSLLLSCTLFFARAGKVDTLSMYSPAMKKDMKFIVISPTVKAPEKGFPVLYLLHGMGGAYNLWITKVPQLQEAADRFGCLIVCPDGGRMTLYFNNPIDSSYRFETHFIKELIPYIDGHYPSSRERVYRSVAGLSMGGFGSFFMASKYPELFGSAGSMSGALNIDPIARSVLARNNKSQVDSSCCSINWDNLKKHNLADSLAQDRVALTMECGLDDYLLQVNRSVHRKLTEMKVAHDYTERPGRHDWKYWDNAIDYQLLFFRKYWDRAGQ